MAFKNQDIYEGYKADRRDGLNRRRCNWHAGSTSTLRSMALWNLITTNTCGCTSKSAPMATGLVGMK